MFLCSTILRQLLTSLMRRKRGRKFEAKTQKIFTAKLSSGPAKGVRRLARWPAADAAPRSAPGPSPSYPPVGTFAVSLGLSPKSSHASPPRRRCANYASSQRLSCSCRCRLSQDKNHAAALSHPAVLTVLLCRRLFCDRCRPARRASGMSLCLERLGRPFAVLAGLPSKSYPKETSD